MSAPMDLAKLTPAERIAGEDAEETRLLREMLGSAKRYIASFRWCPSIERVYYGGGVGGVVAVFLFHFDARIGGRDEWLWVIDGDLPAAYLVTDQAGNPAAVLDGYCQLMDEWAKAVIAGQPLNDVFPVKTEPTLENANGLLKRLNFIKTRLLPDWRVKWGTGLG
jgi:hypothetical protein